jgi:hypothetical protein
MRHFFLLLFVWPVALWAGPRVEFVETQFDFGVLPQGSTVTHTFSLKNSGDSPLTIESVQTTCGCTAATPTNTLIAPGELAQIQVSFDSQGRLGDMLKHVRVQTNDPDQSLSLLTMAGTVALPEVAAQPTPSAPYVVGCPTCPVNGANPPDPLFESSHINTTR